MQALPVVYIDIVWMVNFIMDFALLWTTGWLMKRRPRWKRLLMGALLGATYALALFVPALSPATTWPGKALVSVLMVWIALPHRNAVDLARLVGIYYLVSFVVAGASVAARFALPGTTLNHALWSNRGVAFATSGETLGLMVGLPLALEGLKRLAARLRKDARIDASLVDLEVEFDEHVVRCRALVDTGNALSDPVSKRPVSLMDAEVIMPAFPDAVRERVARGQDVLDALTEALPGTRFAIVPFQGASGRGLTVALRPKAVYLVQADGSRIRGADSLFAVFPGVLSADGTFQAILHPEVMNGVDDDVRVPAFRDQAPPRAPSASPPLHPPADSPPGPAG
ncbi:sigma-E processing peptidase SpoIIGA [Alicyclobacillus vulcanalis]|uniref:Stage II sporulation protein GA (Sporulation sigma-E factor processing peptidase) n=1 Tax=Alicyclobacillus vulcanalis TaxID=252246 RepID=A0A1N7NPR1_9BACL|nr:sigma-E processing peptidase SpoIIGA [Alicyclobacillus vulcanalis]SIT00395.1 sporulation factor SpoIIGA. Unknown type peptidase. MEROPS family U04 [Alicyclobacillus vulcanalis]